MVPHCTEWGGGGLLYGAPLYGAPLFGGEVLLYGVPPYSAPTVQRGRSLLGASVYGAPLYRRPCVRGTNTYENITFPYPIDTVGINDTFLRQFCIMLAPYLF